MLLVLACLLSGLSACCKVSSWAPRVVKSVGDKPAMSESNKLFFFVQRAVKLIIALADEVRCACDQCCCTSHLPRQ